MAHKLANGDYRHNDVLIRHRTVPCSTGYSHEWEIRDVGNHSKTNLHKTAFFTLKDACTAIDNAKT